MTIRSQRVFIIFETQLSLNPLQEQLMNNWWKPQFLSRNDCPDRYHSLNFFNRWGEIVFLCHRSHNLSQVVSGHHPNTGLSVIIKHSSIKVNFVNWLTRRNPTDTGLTSRRNWSHSWLISDEFFIGSDNINPHLINGEWLATCTQQIPPIPCCPYHHSKEIQVFFSPVNNISNQVSKPRESSWSMEIPHRIKIPDWW